MKKTLLLLAILFIYVVASAQHKQGVTAHLRFKQLKLDTRYSPTADIKFSNDTSISASTYLHFSAAIAGLQLDYFNLSGLGDDIWPIKYEQPTLYDSVNTLSSLYPAQVVINGNRYKLKLDKSFSVNILPGHLYYAVENKSTYVVIEGDFLSSINMSGYDYLVMQLENNCLTKYLEISPKQQLTAQHCIDQLNKEYLRPVMLKSKTN